VGKQTEQIDPEQELENIQGEEAEELNAEEQLQKELTEALQEAKVHQEQYVRTLADMENLRKRTQREKEELAKFANENILREILPVVDNLERALEHADQGDSSDGLLQGVQMTLAQFSQVLSRFGVTPIEASGQMFDYTVHQAMGQIESADQPLNSVVQQMQKGYQLNQRLLRPAMVMVAKAPAPPQPEDEIENLTSTEDEKSSDSQVENKEDINHG
jgi:molecular chaperone GrpE